MNVLVTGGAGFIGSHIVDRLITEGAAVRVLDALHPAAHSATPGYINAQADVFLGDLRDEGATLDALRGVDAICHQASMVGLGGSFADVTDYVSANDLGTASLLRALYRVGFRGRLVLASSMVVYGEGRYECSRHGMIRQGPRDEVRLRAGDFDPVCPACGRSLSPRAVPESQPPDPRNVYAATKLHQEHLCSMFAREVGVPMVALRYHNVYGARMPRNTPYAGVASIFRSALERGEAPLVFEDGGQLRDFIHVDDVARANVLALTASARVEGPFNIASGDVRSVMDMARTLADVVAGPEPEVTGQFRRGDVRHVFASPRRAAEVLGFRALIGFEDGMERFALDPLRETVEAGRPQL